MGSRAWASAMETSSIGPPAPRRRSRRRRRTRRSPRPRRRSRAQSIAEMELPGGAMMNAQFFVGGGTDGSQERSAGQAVRGEGSGSDGRAGGAERGRLEEDDRG